MSGILIDTSVWIDHFRRSNESLANLMALDRILIHPMIIGEIACGTPPNRSKTINDLALFVQVRQATVNEVVSFIEREQLFGLGCGFVDLSLLASTILTPNARLWSMDKRLRSLAAKFKVAYQPAVH